MRRGRFNFLDSIFYSPFWSKCRDHFFAFRPWYVILFICALLGFGLGISGAAAYTHKAYSLRFMFIGFGDGYLLGILNGTFNGGRLFWSRILSMLAIFALALCFGLHRFFMPFHFIIVIYRGFLAGFKIAYLVGIYGVTGFFNAIIFILPFETVFFISLSFVTVCAIDRCRAASEFRGLFIRILPSLCAVIAFSILEAILIPAFIGM